MKKMTTILLILLVFTQCNSSLQQSNEELVEISEKVLSNLVKEDFEACRVDFNSTMQSALPADKLQEVWNGLIKQVGAYKEPGETIEDTIQGYRVVYIILKFEESPFKLKVVFDDKDLIAGLFVVPVNAK